MKRLLVFTLIISLCLMSFPYHMQAAENVGSEEESDNIINAEVIEETCIDANMPVGGWKPLEMHYTDKEITHTDTDELRFEKSNINSDINSVFSKGSGHMGYDALDSDAKKSLYLRFNDAAIDFMQSETDLDATNMGGELAYIIDSITFSDLGLSLNDAYQAFVAYDYDHPAYYWISNTVWHSSLSIMMCTEPEYASVSAREVINSQIINGVLETVALTDSVDGVLDKILLVHDKIITDIDYAYESDGVTPEKDKWAHSVQGVFDPALHGAVCEGYADSFSLIMNYLGLPNYYIVGTAGQSGAGGGGGHAWNAVSADGGITFMYMDLTWDDLKEDKGLYYKYFGMPKSDFETTHFKYNSSGEKAKWLYDLDCVLNDSFDKVFYNLGSQYFIGGNANEFAKIIKTKAHRFGNVLTFLGDSLNNVGSVVAALGLSGYSYYTVNYKGTEYYIFSLKVSDKTDLSDATVILPQETYAFEGVDVEPIPRVVCNGITLISGLNYTISYSDNDGPGNAVLTVTGCGNFYGTKDKAFVIDGQGVTPGPTISPTPTDGPTTTPGPTGDPTGYPKRELVPEDFEGVDDWRAEDYTDWNSFLYTGKPHAVEVSPGSGLEDCGEITVYYKAEGTDSWTAEAPKNAGIYLVAIDVSESDSYQSAEKLRANDWKMAISPCLLRIRPDELRKEVGDKDPELTFTYSTYSGEIVGTPGFKGNLTRETGEESGTYRITIGSLELIDNGEFLASNYLIEFFPNASFTIYTLTLDRPEVYVVSKTKHSVVLGWNKVENADGYAIRENGGSELITTSELTYEITGLKTDSSYAYYVRSYRGNPDNYSTNETLIEITTDPRDVPTADDFDFLTEDVIYDGLPHEAIIVPKNDEIEIGHIRYANTETPNAWSFDVPVEPGTYMVDIYVQQTENYEYVYNLTDSTWRFTIKNIIVDQGNCGDQGNNVTWVLDSKGTLTISGSGAMETFVLDYDIIDSTAPWHYACTDIKEVFINFGVTSIGDCAFSGCSNMISVTIPESVTYIGDCAFEGCRNLTSVTIPESVTYIGDSSFYYCKNLISVTIPDNVTYIGGSAFEDCSSLTYITIPNSVTSIIEFTFEGCSSLTSVTIPESVKSIETAAFSSCSNLSYITIPEGVINIGCAAFQDCNNLASITIPNSVTSIEERAFYNCRNLTSVTIPESVTSIGSDAFSNTAWISAQRRVNKLVVVNGILIDGRTCYGEITIPNSVTSIGDSAFYYCSGLKSVTIPDSVTSIGICAFYNCSKLASITIPNSVTSIGRLAFLNTAWLNEQRKVNPLVVINGILIDGKTCSGEIVIPDSVTSIGDSAFEGCSDLTSIIIHNGVTSIGNYTFEGCSGLASVNIPDGVTRIGEEVFYDCSNLTSITIPNSVISIGECAFFDCGNLTSITIPNSLTSIASAAFSGCCSLTSITIPESVTNIGSFAFQECSNLTSITIPKNVTSIGDYAFYGCSELTYVYVKCVGIPVLGYGVFGHTSEELIIFVPVDKVDSYVEAWRDKIYKYDIQTDNNNIRGDVNGDSIINAKDVTVLRRYLAGGWSVEISTENSDLNGDGTINAKDVTILRRFLVGGWGVVLGE